MSADLSAANCVHCGRPAEHLMAPSSLHATKSWLVDPVCSRCLYSIQLKGSLRIIRSEARALPGALWRFLKTRKGATRA